jgi:hypothetical protein
MGLMTYQKFYEIAQKGKSQKSFDDFASSPYYTAFVKFVDRRFTPGKLRTFAFTLRCTNPTSLGNFDGRDTNLAVAVTEIIRRILTEELA